MAGRYRAYPEYRDSGVEWLGEIPNYWDAWKFKHCLLEPMIYGANEAALDDSRENPRYIRITDMNADGTLRDETFKSLPKKVAKDYLLDDGDILLARTGATVGKSFKYKSEFGACCFAGYLIRARANPEVVEPDFIYWYLQSDSYWKHISGSQIQATIQNVSAEKYGDLVIPFPRVRYDRVSIVNFLSVETAKIDTLIEKQQQLIKLLKEKRQAVISHAVTKGLNPNVPMKDSGVEWLGEVPAHWGISKFGYISSVVRGGSPRPAGDPELFNGDYSPWVTVAEITKDNEVYLTSTQTFLTKKGSDQCRIFSKGTLLLSNSGATLGVPKILDIDANANDGVVGFENLQLDIEFAYYYLLTLTDDLRERIKQGSGQPNLNTDIVKAISVPVPPVKEVEVIVRAIRQMRSTYSILIEKANSGIQLLQERRTALISAAVTGKIDVRDWQPPAGAEAASLD